MNVMSIIAVVTVLCFRHDKVMITELDVGHHNAIKGIYLVTSLENPVCNTK